MNPGLWEILGKFVGLAVDWIRRKWAGKDKGADRLQAEVKRTHEALCKAEAAFRAAVGRGERNLSQYIDRLSDASAAYHTATANDALGRR